MPLSSHHACERARVLASVGLDRSLSSFERQRLDSHRSRCQECDAVIAGMTQLTSRVRSADSLATGLPALRVPGLRRVAARRRRALALRVAGAAAAMAASAVLGFVAASHPGAGSHPTAAGSRVTERVSLVLAQGKARGRHLLCQQSLVYDCGVIAVPLGTPLVGAKGGVSPPNATMRSTWR